MNSVTHLVRLCAALFLLPCAAPAQDNGIDPPTDGTIVEHLAVPQSLSDGYQTLMDIRLPTATPHPGGWPLVVMVHGSGSGRQSVTGGAVRFAELGFATVTYDVRGQGDAMALNDPLAYGRGSLGLRERLDLFEVIEGAAAAFPGLIGVTGGSQGGVHAWMAAAHSGRVPPLNPWRTAPFPVITAVAPFNFSADLLSAALPGDNTISEARMRAIYGANSGIHLDPAYFGFIDPLIRAEDYQSIFAGLNDPELDMPELLKTSSVSVLATMVYDDNQAPANSLVDLWPSIVPGAQKVLQLTTGGHDTPFNQHEDDILDRNKRMWFQHHLKQVQNGVDNLPPFHFAITPADVGDYLSPDSLWDFREFSSFPMPGARTETWYLSRGSLDPQPPSRTRRENIDQNADGLYSIIDYISGLPTPEELMQTVPISALSHTSGSITEDLLLMGEGSVTLNIQSDDADLQLHAALFEEPSGRYITGGQVALRGYAGGSSQVTIPLNFSTFKIRQGSRLRLEIENLAWHRPPSVSGGTVFHSLPIFHDFQLDVRYGGNDPARLDLPIAPLGGPTLVQSAPGTLRNNPQNFHFAIHGDSSMDGWSYQLLVGSSGTEPGHFVNGVHVPLNRDGLTLRVENNPGSVPITDFTGLLNGEGFAAPAVLLGNLASIPANIQELVFVAVLVSPTGETVVTNPTLFAILD